MASDIAIVGGSGSLGFGLSLRLAKAGHSIVVGSRTADKAQDAAQRVKALVPDAAISGATNLEATAQAEKFVILAVPFASQAATIKEISEAINPSVTVVDTSVPLGPAIGGKPTTIIGVWQGSAAQQAQSLVPKGVQVTSAFHTTSAELLETLGTELDQDVLIAGNGKDSKAATVALVNSIDGLRGVDAGRLDQSRIIESMTALLIGINIRNKKHTGIKIQGL